MPAYTGRGLSMAMLIASFAMVADARQFTEDFPVEECHLHAYGGNPFFILSPGRQAYFSNQRCVAAGDCEELEELWITVTRQTKTITLRADGRTLSIPTRVVQEYETADGELVEISRNYFASCSPDRLSCGVRSIGRTVIVQETRMPAPGGLER